MKCPQSKRSHLSLLSCAAQPQAELYLDQLDLLYLNLKLRSLLLLQKNLQFEKKKKRTFLLIFLCFK